MAEATIQRPKIDYVIFDMDGRTLPLASSESAKIADCVHACGYVGLLIDSERVYGDVASTHSAGRCLRRFHAHAHARPT